MSQQQQPGAVDKKAVAKGYLNFKVKDPLSKFKEVFKKEVDQQWLVSKAMFINLVIQAINLACITFTQSTLWVRMELEVNEHRRAMYAFLIHIVTWVYLCYLRRKHFVIPKMLGFLTFNTFYLTYFYLQSYMLTANTLGDPNSKIIYSTFALSDCFFGFLYVTLSDYIYPYGHLSFCMFPKLFFGISFYFFFDDRSGQILQFFITTSIMNYLQGLEAQELLLDCLDEEIVEFGALDYYTLLYLDVPYILRKSLEGLQVVFTDYKERMNKPKSAADKYDKIDEAEVPAADSQDKKND